MGRSILAVVIGFFLIALLSFGADMVLMKLAPGAFNPTGGTGDPAILLLAQAYVGIFAVGGCYLSARLAPGRPMRHALILGALGLAFQIAGRIAMWETQPAWSHVLGLALVLPFAWAGGRLWEMEQARTGAGAVQAA